MKTLHLLFLAFIASALSSCMTIDSIITVKTDGSGTIVEKMVLKEAAKKMLEALPGVAEGENPMFDEAQYKARAKKLGVELVGVKKVEGKDDGVEVTYKFADISKLKYTPSEGSMSGGDLGAGEAGIEEPEEEDQPITFAFTPGSPAKLKVKLPDDFHDPKAGAGEAAGDADELDAAGMVMMAQMFKGMKMRALLRFEKKIVATDATISKNNDVILMFMDFDKVMGAPGGLKKLMELDGSDREAINKTSGLKMELKDEFEVTFE